MKSKYDAETWKKVQAVYETGEPLKSIEKKTGINRGSISRKATREGWEKTKLQPLVDRAISVELEKDGLDATQREVVETTIDEKVRATRLVHQLTKLNLRDISGKLGVGLDSIVENKMAQDAIDKASLTLGVNQRFASNFVNVSNENTVSQIRIIRDDEDS